MDVINGVSSEDILVKVMIAYIDESVKKGVLSIGIYISRGFDKPIRDYIVKKYNSIWRIYGVGTYQGEAKFSKFAAGLKRKSITLAPAQFRAILNDITEFMRDLGQLVAVVVENTKIAHMLMPSLYGFLIKLKIPRSTIEKYLLISLAIDCRKIRSIIFDTGFQISIKSIKRILKALGINIEIKTAGSIQHPGLEIADFIAGIAPFIQTFNINLYWYMNCKIFRIMKE